MNGSNSFAGKLSGFSRYVKSVILLCAVLLVSFSSMPVISALVAQDFKSSEDLPIGTIVSLGSSSSEVTRASSTNLSNLYGVVTRVGDISLGNGATGAKTVSVANSDVVDVLVSTANGPIKQGDIISVSGVAGVGEKASISGPAVGVAQESFSEDSPAAQSLIINSKSIKVGLIQMKVGIINYQHDDGKSADRNSIERIADTIAGKRITLLSLIVAATLLLGGVLTAVFLIASSAYASMVALGRNPLSEKKIIRSLVRIVCIAVGIFIIGVLLAFTSLKLL